MVKHLERENDFAEIIKGKILVDFYADWCGPCQMMGPVLESLDSIEVLKVNTDMFPELARSYGIMSIPTLILFENEKEVKKIIGFHPKEELDDWLK